MVDLALVTRCLLSWLSNRPIRALKGYIEAFKVKSAVDRLCTDQQGGTQRRNTQEASNAVHATNAPNCP